MDSNERSKNLRSLIRVLTFAKLIQNLKIDLHTKLCFTVNYIGPKKIYKFFFTFFYLFIVPCTGTKPRGT